MIINSIELKNFRCFYGKQALSFSAGGKITLIYGDSGYGKSSFLQFFRWMFYNDPDFGKNDDKPLFNIAAYEETKLGQNVEVSGQIDFEHLGVKYRLNKTQLWSCTTLMANSQVQRADYRLQVLEDDGGYHPVPDDVSNIINSILPKGLSKYFLLDGERARDIVLDSNELKKAIHSLFGIDAYSEAISHIGNKNAKSSVLGYYSMQLASSVEHTTVGNLSIPELQESMQELYESMEDVGTKRLELMGQIEVKSKRRDEIFKQLGEAAAKGNIEQLIAANNNAIKQNENDIKNIRNKIGDLFYKTYPYLLLAEITSKSSAILREKKLEFAATYKSVFENVRKDLLKEILAKQTCICGRPLDDASSKYISGIIGVMPPDSYTYRFGQFVAHAKRQIRFAQNEIMMYEDLLNKITQCELNISKLEDANREKLEELKRLEDAKDLVIELEQLKSEIELLAKSRIECERKLAQQKQLYTKSGQLLNNALKSSKVSLEFNEKIAFFEKICELLRKEKDAKEQQVKIVLNSCVREIFKKLTTQTELDADKIQFVNDDFSLRTTYLTGGQLAVDVYSYVIGIVKALQECKMENNENPIVIDAPFAFTGTEQSEHLFKTLPSVSKQTILLTLDLNKIKSLLGETSVYDFYVIKNETQEKARFERGDINGIKF